MLEQLKLGTRHLSEMAKQLDIRWEPDESDVRKLHNGYVKNLVCCYVSKFVDLSRSLLDGLGRCDYLTYALCGRAMIEAVATLRYYVVLQYKPLLDKQDLTGADFKQLIQIDDRHLRGTRFDWDAFLFQNYTKLKADVVSQLASKKDKARPDAQADRDAIQPQVNVMTCIEKWGTETPEVVVAYNLFCDLVHPNVGSNFLVASVEDGKIYFTKDKGRMVGHDIFEQSFPILVSVTMKPFGTYLSVLMATCWQEDELRTGGTP